MRKIPLFALFVLALSGCISVPTVDVSGVVNAEPVAYPHPGIYTAATQTGVLTFKINEDGTGQSCFRNAYGGHLFLGDLKYDGSHIHTEDGSYTASIIDENALHVAVGQIDANMRRVEQPPTNCREFFET